MGPNGSGKSTLLEVIAGRLWPQCGTVSLLGAQLGKVDIRRLRPQIALVGSKHHARIVPSMTVQQVLAGGVHDVLAPWWLDEEAASGAGVKEVLRRFGLLAFADHAMGTLSDGERTRTLLARSFVTKPKLWLLDEPTRALDIAAREEVLDALSAGFADPALHAAVLVSHQVEDIPLGMTHALLLKEGQVVSQGPIRSVLTSHDLSECFGLPIEVQSSGERFFARAMRR